MAHITFSEAHAKIMINLCGKTWFHQSGDLVLNYNGIKMNLRSLNNEVGIEAYKSPKTNFLERETMLMYKVNFYMMVTP